MYAGPRLLIEWQRRGKKARRQTPVVQPIQKQRKTFTSFTLGRFHTASKGYGSAPHAEPPFIPTPRALLTWLRRRAQGMAGIRPPSRQTKLAFNHWEVQRKLESNPVINQYLTFMDTIRRARLPVADPGGLAFLNMVSFFAQHGKWI